MKKYQHYINGEWTDASSKDLIPVLNPANEEIIGEITCGKDEDINHAVESAKKAYESRILVDMNPMERAKLMRRIAKGVSSAGFMTVEFPAANEHAKERAIIEIGKFHGTMWPDTP